MLTTDRLFLLPTTLPLLDAIVESDWSALAARLGGVDFADNWMHFPEAYAWLRDYLSDHNDEPEWWSYLIVHRQDARLIGTCGYKGAPDPLGAIEIGYEIADSYQGQGLGTEAAQALCEFGFAQPGVQAITAQTLGEENASCRILRKLGFQFVQEKVDMEDGLLWEWKREKWRDKTYS